MYCDDVRRCPCGQVLNSYNVDTLCGSCDRARVDEHVRLAEIRARESPLPPPRAPLTCRQPGCNRPIAPKSAATNAPRWRELCAEHYQEQRERQSRSAKTVRTRMAAAAQG